MEFRYHPIIEELRVNEDGTEIYLKDILLRSFENDKTRENPTLKVNFNSKGHSITKLICEAWNGLREHSGQRVSKVDILAGNHYSNLEWKEGASNGIRNFKQKLTTTDIDQIVELLETDKSIREIAKMYDVHFATIARIKKKYAKEDQ